MVEDDLFYAERYAGIALFTSEKEKSEKKRHEGNDYGKQSDPVAGGQRFKPVHQLIKRGDRRCPRVNVRRPGMVVKAGQADNGGFAGSAEVEGPSGEFFDVKRVILERVSLALQLTYMIAQFEV